MTKQLEEFKFQNIDLLKIKKPFSAILLIIALFCGILLIPGINTAIAGKAESIKSIASLNTTWSILITSFALFGIIVALTVLFGIYLVNISKKIQFFLYIIFVSILLVFITVITYKYAARWVNSDHSSDLVLGKFLADENALMSSKWYYSTEIRVIYQNFFLIPLFKIFDNWHLVRALTVFFNNILLLVAYHIMMRQTNINIKWIRLTSIFLLMPTNFVYFDIVTFGGFYVFYLAMFFCFISLFIYMIKNTGAETKHKKILLPLFSILAFLYGLCGVRSIMDFFLPLFIVTLFIFFYKHIKTQYPIVLGIIGLIFSGIGFVINSSLYFVYKYSSDLKVIWDDPFGTIFTKIGHIIWFFPMYIGFEGRSLLFTPNGIISLFSIILIVTLLIIGYKLLSLKKENRPVIKFPETFILSFFFITLLYHACLYTVINSQYMTLRYFIIVFIFYIPALAILFEKMDLLFPAKVKNTFIIFTAITLFGSGAIRFHQFLLRPDMNSNRHGYIEFLEKNNLHFGFSTYWNANVTTELTSGRIIIGGINEETRTTHDEWLTKREYENPDYYDKEIFVLYSKEEWDGIKDDNRFRLKKPVYEDSHFIVLTYPSTKVFHEQQF